MGFNELGRGDTIIYEFQVSEDTATFFGIYKALGRSPNLFIGKDSLYTARILLDFGLPDTIEKADSAFMVLYERKGYPRQKILVKGFPIIQKWEEAGVTWILSSSIMKWLTPGGEYDSTKLLLSFDTSFKDSLVIKLSPQILDDLVNNDGLLFKPEEEGFFYFVSKEGEIGKRPKVVAYFKKDKEEYFPIADASVVNSNKKEPHLRFVGSGYVYKALLSFPIMDSLPKVANIISAELLALVEGIYFPKDTLEIGVYKIKGEWDGKYTQLGELHSKASFKVKDGNLVIPIRKMVQEWITHPDSFFGLSLSIYPENYDISLVKLKVPIEIRVVYMEPPEKRF